MSSHKQDSCQLGLFPHGADADRSRRSLFYLETARPSSPSSASIYIAKHATPTTSVPSNKPPQDGFDPLAPGCQVLALLQKHSSGWALGHRRRQVKRPEQESKTPKRANTIYIKRHPQQWLLGLPATSRQTQVETQRDRRGASKANCEFGSYHSTRP